MNALYIKIGLLASLLAIILPSNGGIYEKRYVITTDPAPPWVVTTFATDVDPWGKHATLNGILLSKGFVDECDVWFVWDTSFHFFYPSYAYSTPHIKMRRIGRFSETITGLERGVTYHFRAVADNGYFSDQGIDLWFTPGMPHVETLDATDIDNHSAILHGKLTDNGGVECNVWFVYGISPNKYTFSTNYIRMKTIGTFSQKIENLSPGTTYYFCAVVSNDVGKNYGEEKNFTTLLGKNNPPYTPDRPTGPIWGKSGREYSYSASTIDPDGDLIRYYFDWGDGNRNWSRWKKSGEAIKMSHVWQTDGIYRIRVKAQDEKGMESNWSPPLNVTIESIPPSVYIFKPRNALYIFDRKIMPLLFSTIIIGKITIEVNASDKGSGVSYVKFYIDDVEKCNISQEPYAFIWDEKTFFSHTIKAVAYDKAGNVAEDSVRVKKFF